MKNIIFIMIISSISLSLLPQGIAMGAKTDPAQAKMESMLFQLADSDNPQEFANKHGIEIKDGSVKVVIETAEGFQPAILDKYHIKIIRQYRDLIKAYVGIDVLHKLAKEDKIKFIRIPYKPIPLQKAD